LPIPPIFYSEICLFNKEVDFYFSFVVSGFNRVETLSFDMISLELNYESKTSVYFDVFTKWVGWRESGSEYQNGNTCFDAELN
jgi:hypothetical protein